MNQPGRKLESEPEPDLGVKVESSDDLDLVSSPDQGTHLARSEERYCDNIVVATGSSSISVGVKPEEHTFDEIQPPSEQPDSGSDVDTDADTNIWAVDYLMKMHQENFMEEYRDSATQNNTQLVQAVQSEVQTGMDQIVGYIRNFVARSSQSSASLDVESLKSQLQAEKTHVKDLKNRYDILKRAFSQKQEEAQKSNAKLQDALQEKNRLRRLLDGGSLANSSKVTDDDIKSKWDKINYNIRCLVHLLDTAPSAHLVDDEVADRLRFLSRQWRKILHEPELREFLLRGYLWVLIQDNVFNSGENLWGGPELRSYKAARISLIDRIGDIEGRSEHKPSVDHVARWLAQGSTMMGEVWDEDTNAFKHMMRTEVKRLQPFASDCQSRADRTGKKISYQLSDIINSAIELDKMMMCSKAIFLVDWWDSSQGSSGLQRWNPEVMEAEAWEKDLSQKSHVKLRLSPILYKFGTADGHNYDSRMVLAKSGVVCD